MACSLDVGTANLVSARLVNSEVQVKRLRNCFVSLSEEQLLHLSKSGGLNSVQIKNQHYIVGDEAVQMARIFGAEVRRPMASGVINPEERDGRSVVGALVKALLGEPEDEGEKCCFSIPANPVDNPSANNIWHTGFFTNLIEDLGYDAEPVNEALAIVYAECGDDDHSGIAISHGGGQINVAASYKLVGSLNFSICRGGDWIDKMTAASVGSTVARVLKVKEDPNFDLQKSDEFDEESIGPALEAYYQALIKYEITHLVQQWTKLKTQLDFPDAIPVILSGGTASLKGFKEMWEKELYKFAKKNPLPFKVKEVRMAKDPLGAVARGLLTYALSY
jgi:actin-like ATPase involved in cell morphogenesis